MAIPAFKNGRMFVGWRRRDYKLVYYKPYAEEGADDNMLPVSLYFVNQAGEEEDAMTEGEVLFLPYFAYENCETKSKLEKKMMQLRNLMRAHELYKEQDPAAFDELMHEADDPGWARWNSIMTEIKRFKNGKMKAKETRRQRKEERKKILQRAGVPRSEIDANLTSDDSGFEDDIDANEVGLQSRRGRRQSTMGPPASKRSNATGKYNSGPSKRNKRGLSGHHTASRHGSEDFQMSGGMGHGDVTDDSLPYDIAPPQNPDSSRRSGERDDSGGLFVSSSRAETVDLTDDGNIERLQKLSGHTRTSREIEETIHEDLDEAEAEALRQAIEMSQQPEDIPQGDIANKKAINGDLDDEEAFRRVVRMSEQPEERPRVDVAESTEE